MVVKKTTSGRKTDIEQQFQVDAPMSKVLIRSMEAVDIFCDACWLEDGLSKNTLSAYRQDLNIFSLAVKKGKGIVFIVNKWDLVEKVTNTAKDYEKQLKERLAPFTDIPIIFISAKEKTRVFKVIETALDVCESRKRRIPTSKLNDEMLPVIEAYTPPIVRGNSVKIKFVTQLPTAVPSFAFFANYPDDIKTPYRNYLENKLRERFNFKGVPVRIFFRKK
jgi:GTP-binding protein